jgi:4-hydroxybenzoate polyprenyltransferase
VTQQAGAPDPFGPDDPAAQGGAAASGPKAPGMLGGLPDSGQGKFLFRLTPKSWHPYIELARLDRPTGWWLLLLPCWWSSALASLAQGAPLNLRDLALFFAGAVVMRGAGSTYNDIVDRDIDWHVTRTRSRPLASKRTGVKSAALFLGAQCLAGLAVLLSFNRFTVYLGFASLGIVGLYPFMKRISTWPQAVLGAAFAWGALVGWSAAFGSLAAAPVLLYFGAFFWIIGFDTIYALQDLEDDILAGIGSTARAFGRHVRVSVGCLYLAAALFAGMAVWTAGGGAFAQGGVLLFAAHLAWQVTRIDAGGGAAALRLFRSNRDAGLALFAGLAAQVLFLPG